jgi:hypothetical protein
VDVPDSIVYYLLLQNCKHFGQAQGTPFTEPPFSTQVDWEASSCQAELILNGDYDSSELDDLTELLLINHCRNMIPLDKRCYHHRSRIHLTLHDLEREDIHLSLWIASRSLQGPDR